MSERYKLHAVFFVTELRRACVCRFPEELSVWEDCADSWRLLCVERGRLQAGSSLLRSGEAVLCPPGSACVVRPPERTAEAVLVAFDCSWANMAMLEGKPLTLGAEERRLLSVILTEAAVLNGDAPFGCEQIIKGSLEQLLVRLSRLEGSCSHDGYLRTPESLVAELRHYMSLHVREKLTLTFLAERYSVSVSQLKRVFKERTGTSVIAYLTDLRIAAAKALIRENKLNFSQIAEAVGYDNIYYFSTMFKKQTGMTPTEYARSVRK